MKSLQDIQKVFNAGKIISKIGKVFCIVFACIGAFGILGIAFIPDNFKIGGTTIKGIVETSAKGEGAGYASLAVLIIMCIGYAILFSIAEKCFLNELKAGTPFTLEGSKELTLLGLYTVCIPLISNFACEAAVRILARFMSGISEYDFDYNMTVGLGLAIMIMGMICRCATEIINEKKEDKDENISV